MWCHVLGEKLDTGYRFHNQFCLGFAVSLKAQSGAGKKGRSAHQGWLKYAALHREQIYGIAQGEEVG